MGLTTQQFMYKRFPDGCYAIVIGKRRGPCANSLGKAKKRFLKSGLIKSVNKGA